MSRRALIIHYSPTIIYVACTVNGNVINVRELSHYTTSKNLIPCITELLNDASWDIRDCSYVGAAQGPGAFTTLRSIIVTVNGLAFATDVPLLGFNILELLAHYACCTPYTETYAISDAFNHDVHVSHYVQKTGITTTATFPYDELCIRLEKECTEHSENKILVIGTGLEPRSHNLKLPHQGCITYNLQLTHAPLEFVAYTLDDRWVKQINVVRQLIPLYGKSYESSPIKP